MNSLNSSKKLKFSFVIPVKNGEKFIKDTIQSIQNQTEKNLEVIVVDDHSQDDTLEIVNSLSAKDKRIKILFLTKASGVAAGRNLGTLSASGEIILPSDADDPSYADRAKISLQELQKSKTDIFYGNLMRLYVDSNKLELRHFQPYDAKLLQYINYIAHSGASAYYKYVFDKIGGYDETIKIGEDYDFWLKAQEAGFKFCSENIPLAQYTMHAKQVTNVSDPQKVSERQQWNQIIRKKHNIYEVDLDHVKKHATPEVYEFYIEKNFEIWFGEKSIPKKY